MDVDSIALGRDFRLVLQERLETCDFLLALIGPDWLDIKDTAGNRRLGPTDFVSGDRRRLEAQHPGHAGACARGADAAAGTSAQSSQGTRLPERFRDQPHQMGVRRPRAAQAAGPCPGPQHGGSTDSGRVDDVTAQPGVSRSTGHVRAARADRPSPAATWAGVGWKKIVFGALGMTVLLVVIAQLQGGPGIQFPRARRRPHRTSRSGARVSPPVTRSFVFSR